jgi:hypothetical protein
MTSLKPDGGPECTGIFRFRAAFDIDGGSEHSGPVFTPIRGRSGPVLPLLYNDRYIHNDVRWRPFWITTPSAVEFQLQRLKFQF